MTIALWCVFVAGLLPYIATGLAKGGPEKFDNNEPRAWIARQTGAKARANAAQMNSFEVFPFFAAAVEDAGDDHGRGKERENLERVHLRRVRPGLRAGLPRYPGSWLVVVEFLRAALRKAGGDIGQEPGHEYTPKRDGHERSFRRRRWPGQGCGHDVNKFHFGVRQNADRMARHRRAA